MIPSIHIDVSIPTEWQIAQFALEKNIVQAKFLRCKRALGALGNEIPLTIFTVDDIYFPFDDINNFESESKIPEFIGSLRKRTDMMRRTVENYINRMPPLLINVSKYRPYQKIVDEMMLLRTRLISQLEAAILS